MAELYCACPERHKLWGTFAQDHGEPDALSGRRVCAKEVTSDVPKSSQTGSSPKAPLICKAPSAKGSTMMLSITYTLRRSPEEERSTLRASVRLGKRVSFGTGRRWSAHPHQVEIMTARTPPTRKPNRFYVPIPATRTTLTGMMTGRPASPSFSVEASVPTVPSSGRLVRQPWPAGRRALPLAQTARRSPRREHSQYLL
jgi:hypothetical protein